MYELEFANDVHEGLRTIGIARWILREFYGKAQDVLCNDSAFQLMVKVNDRWQLPLHVQETATITHQFLLRIDFRDSKFLVESVSYRRNMKRGSASS